MSRFSTKIDWAGLFFDSQSGWQNKMMALANRRFAGTADADSAYNFALEEISADDWQRLSAGYKGTGSPAGFLRITFVRLLEEYAVRKYGRRRPPVWVKRLGTMWVRIFELLCLKRLLPGTIVDTLGARGEHSPDLIRDAITQIRGRIPGCGQYVGEYLAGEDGLNPGDTEGVGEGPEPELEETELAELLGAIAGLLAEAPASQAEAAGETANPARKLTLIERRDRIRARLPLTDQERLILRLVYQDGFSIARTARAVRMHEQKVRRTHKGLIARIHESLAGVGLDAAAVGRLVDR